MYVYICIQIETSLLLAMIVAVEHLLKMIKGIITFTKVQYSAAIGENIIE